MKIAIGLLSVLAVSLVSAQSLNNAGIQNRIISGSQAAVGQFPWQVTMKKDEFDNLLCGGSIISQTWVLTAGHCVYGIESVFMQFGTINLSGNNAVSQTSSNFVIHPDYNEDNLNNDIALIALSEPLKFSTVIQPIALGSSDNLIGTIAFIAGYGLMDDENLDYSKILLWALVEIINNNQCEYFYGKDVVKPSNLCAEGANGSNMSICSGDSGGPLIIYVNGTPQQIGINSYVAQDMCTEGYPSAYTSVSYYQTFIKNTINS